MLLHYSGVESYLSAYILFFKQDNFSTAKTGFRVKFLTLSTSSLYPYSRILTDRFV